MADHTTSKKSEFFPKRLKAAHSSLESTNPELLPLCFLHPLEIGNAVTNPPFSTHIRRKKDTVLLACFPRSGSTYTFQVMAKVLGYRKVSLCYARQRSDHDLYVPFLLSNLDKPTLSQHHLKATEANIALINAFNIKVVVLVRNLENVLISLFHTIRNYPPPHAYTLDEDSSTWPDDLLIDYLIQYRVPWYLDFFISWARALHRGEIRGHIVTYEHMTDDETDYFSTICSSLQRPVEMEDIRAAADDVREKGNFRLSGGARERVDPILSPQQKDRIAQMGKVFERSFDWLDLSLIGI